jgi:AraC-like DNA-binding protein
MIHNLMRFNVGGEIAGAPKPLFSAYEEISSPEYSTRGYTPSRTYYIFSCTLSGDGAFTESAKTRKLPPGAALLMKMPDPERYFHYPKDGAETWRRVYIEFDGGSLSPALDGMIKNHGFIYELAADSDIVRRMLELRKGWPGRLVNIGAFEGSNLIFRILAALKECESKTQIYRSGLLRDICSHISENIGSPLTVQGIAKKFSISRGHLCLLFRENLRCPPLKYINAERTRRICHLVAESDIPFAEAASKAGIGDLTQFYHLFKRVTGMTPGEFRKSDRKFEIIKTL